MEKDQNSNTNNLSEKENSKPDKDSSPEKTKKSKNNKILVLKRKLVN